MGHKCLRGQSSLEAMLFVIAFVLALVAMVPYIRDGIAFHFKRSSDSVSGYMPFAR